MSESLSEDTAKAIERLRRIDEFEQHVPPAIVLFSRFVASRLHGRDFVTPREFIEIGSLSAFALQRRIDVEETVSLDLLGKDPNFYIKLYDSLPSLAEAAFSEHFAREVGTIWQAEIQKAKESKNQQNPEPDS